MACSWYQFHCHTWVEVAAGPHGNDPPPAIENDLYFYYCYCGDDVGGGGIPDTVKAWRDTLLDIDPDTGDPRTPGCVDATDLTQVSVDHNGDPLPTCDDATPACWCLADPTKPDGCQWFFGTAAAASEAAGELKTTFGPAPDGVSERCVQTTITPPTGLNRARMCHNREAGTHILSLNGGKATIATCSFNYASCPNCVPQVDAIRVIVGSDFEPILPAGTYEIPMGSFNTPLQNFGACNPSEPFSDCCGGCVLTSSTNFDPTQLFCVWTGPGGSYSQICASLMFTGFDGTGTGTVCVSVGITIVDTLGFADENGCPEWTGWYFDLGGCATTDITDGTGSCDVVSSATDITNTYTVGVAFA
jgi:hypothetical protein